MRWVVTSEEMRALEARYMACAVVPFERLMETAAQAVAQEAMRLAGGPGRTALFACGLGGNGGDGYAAARLYAGAGGRSIVVSALGEDRLTGDALTMCRRAHETGGVAFAAPDALPRLDCPAVWVDAMFGIGLSRDVSGFPLDLIRRMARDRDAGARILSVDMPSGLNAHTGRVMGGAVCATHTVTFEYAKPGHLLGMGLALCGELIIAPLGIPGRLLPPGAILWPDASDARGALKPRRRVSHKGDYGHLLLVAGSAGMAGAAIMAAGAALRSGVGLVTVACPASLVPILQTTQPSAMCVPLEEEDGAISALALPRLLQALEGKQALAVGPGLSTRCAGQIAAACLSSGLPAVVDADALNLIARDDALRALLRPHHLITPHPGEAARLLGRPCENPLEDARALRALGATAMLKGAASIVAGERTYVRTTGSSGLAKGGSGDVLTGMAGALLAQGYPALDAGWIAATLHGALGEIAARHLGDTAMTAADLIGFMGEVWGDVG